MFLWWINRKIVEKNIGSSYVPVLYIYAMPKLFLFLILIFFCQRAEAQRLRVMSYNIHIGQDASGKDQLAELAKYIKVSGADIIGLQEVDSVCNRSGKIDQMAFLAAATGLYFAYERHFAFDGGSYGIGILSKYPLKQVEQRRISLGSVGICETRAFLAAKVIVHGVEVLFATVHMDYRDAGSREKQAEELLAFSKGKKNLVLTGDFNTEPNSPDLQVLEQNLRHADNKMLPTYPPQAPVKRIDYIMVNKESKWRTSSHEVPSVFYSDHLPVLAEFKF